MHFMQATLISYDYGIKEYQHLKDQKHQVNSVYDMPKTRGSQNLNSPD